jgi:hypothetical protein
LDDANELKWRCLPDLALDECPVVDVLLKLDGWTQEPLMEMVSALLFDDVLFKLDVNNAWTIWLLVMLICWILAVEERDHLSKVSAWIIDDVLLKLDDNYAEVEWCSQWKWFLLLLMRAMEIDVNYFGQLSDAVLLSSSGVMLRMSLLDGNDVNDSSALYWDGDAFLWSCFGWMPCWC